MFGFTFNLYGPTCERDKLLKNGWKCDFTKQALASTAKAEYNRILLWHHWHKSKSTNSDHCDREALSPEVSLQSSPVSSQKTYDFEGSHRWPGWPWRVACRHPRWPNSDLLSLPTSAASCQHHAKRCCAFAVFSHRFSFRNHCAIIVAEYGLSWFIPVVPSSKSKTSSCRPAAAAHAGLMPRKRCARWTECDQSPVESSTFQGLSTVQPVSMEFWLRSRPSVDFVKFASWQRKFTSRSFKRTEKFSLQEKLLCCRIQIMMVWTRTSIVSTSFSLRVNAIWTLKRNFGGGFVNNVFLCSRISTIRKSICQSVCHSSANCCGPSAGSSMLEHRSEEFLMRS